MATNASSFTSPLAERFAAVSLPPQIEYVVDIVANAGIVTWLVTLLALAVTYDQGMPDPP
jgi:C-22 sterol desaturase